MAVEKKFVEDGFTKALINEFLTKELARAGYGGMVMNRTPMGTQITVYAEKPGMVIGKGGKLIRKLTRDLDRKFKLDNPQIDVQDVGKAELNAQVVANRLASSLERGWYFRKASQSMIRRVMESGALGCEIVLSGKLTGPRSRTEKVIRGYIKHSGKPSEELVDYGYAMAVKKLGSIGCQVRIVQPDVVPPDEFEIIAPPEPVEEEVPAPEEAAKDELEELLETEAVEAEAVAPEEEILIEEVIEEAEPEETQAEEVVEEAEPEEEAQAEEVIEEAEPEETPTEEVVEEAEPEEEAQAEEVVEEAEPEETPAEEVVEEAESEEEAQAEEVVEEAESEETQAEEVIEEAEPEETPTEEVVEEAEPEEEAQAEEVVEEAEPEEEAQAEEVIEEAEPEETPAEEVIEEAEPEETPAEEIVEEAEPEEEAGEEQQDK